MIRIISASVLSVFLVAGAYAISGPVPFLTSKFASAQSTDELLKAYAAKDSDNDGLPDWQETLYGTDPNNPHSVQATLTDAEAVSKGLVTPKTTAVVAVPQSDTTGATAADVPGPNPAPGSLTDQFGQEFFQDYISASGGQQLTAEQQQALINQLMTSYSQKASALLLSKYTMASIHVSSTATVSSYVGSLENILRTDDTPPGTGMLIPLMQAYLQNNDTSVKKQIADTSASYAAITKDLLQVPVPASLASLDLTLIQSFDTLARATKAITNYQNDPLAVMGSLALLQPTSQTVMVTISSLAQAVIAANGEPGANDPGALIVHIARTAEQSL